MRVLRGKDANSGDRAWERSLLTQREFERISFLKLPSLGLFLGRNPFSVLHVFSKLPRVLFLMY